MKRPGKLPIAVLMFLMVSCGGDMPDRRLPVFRYNESKGVTSLDPAYARNLANIWPVNQLFNGLLQLSDSLSVEPAIARKWQVSADGTEYTFWLRSDVFFHDSPVFPHGRGRRVTASDFCYSFGRILDPEVASPGRWAMAVFDTDAPGFTNGCRAVNDSVLRIRLKKPFPPLPGLLTMPYFFVVPHEAVEQYGADFGQRPVGTGPFRFKLWRKGEKLVLRRNNRYFEKDSSGQRLPYIEAVAVTFIADKQSELMEFLLGKLDFLSGVTAVSKDELLTRSGLLRSKHARTIRMVTAPYLNTEYLGVLLDSSRVKPDSPLLDRRVRKAVACGFNRKDMMLYLRGNMGYPANAGLVPPAMPGFDSLCYGFTYNPDLARKLLAQAGYPNGKGLPPITLATTTDYLDICEYVQHQLGKLGVRISVEVLPGSAYRDMMANSKLELFRASWVADYADPQNYLALFYSENFSPDGPNYTHFRLPKYDSLYRLALAEPLYRNRIRYYRQMDSLVVDCAAVIPLYYDKVVRFVNKRVTGLGVNPMNLLVLKRVRIANP